MFCEVRQRVRRKKDEGQADGSLPVVDERARSERERVLVCSSCGHQVARPSDRIEVNGHHRHTCVNPAGYVYRIRCFRRAEGCVGVGEWTDYHSWFAGYFWQVACCGRCSIHLGWAFNKKDDEFSGLIADRVEERDAEQE